MKIRHFLILLVFVSCANKVEKKDDPIEKSEFILKAISNEEYEFVRNQYVGRKETTEKHKGTLDTLSMEIFQAIKKYGFPNKNQIIIIDKEKLEITKDYGDEFNGSPVDVVSTKTSLDKDGKFDIEMGFILKNGEVRLLRIGVRDRTQHSH